MAKNYASIVRSSTIVGGAQGLSILVGMIRNKGVAIFLGPSGLGEMSLLTSSLGLMSAICGLGIGTSAVREIASANSSGDTRQLSETVTVLQRVCWLTGLCGWGLTALLAGYFSRTAFGNADYAFSIAVLGITILIGNLTIGQTAVLQGTRRVGNLARQTVIGAILGTMTSLLLFWQLGKAGILPALISVAICNLATAWWYVRQTTLEPLNLPYVQSLLKAKAMVATGITFMVASLAGTFASWLIHTVISRHFGTSANGVYAAAWSLSAQFAQFILTAMAADYYPRLTAVTAEPLRLNALVNEQTEIGVLLALPGLLATLAFAPWLVYAFYSSEFADAAILLPWLVLGLLGRVISWPIGYVVIALGRGTVFATFEIFMSVIHVGFVYFFSQAHFLEGTTIAFAIQYLAYLITMYAIVWRMTGFRWTRSLTQLLLASIVPVSLAIASGRFLPPHYSVVIGTILTVIVSWYCMRGLTERLGPDHRLTRLMARFSLVRPG